jgi:hypothetical protein
MNDRFYFLRKTMFRTGCACTYVRAYETPEKTLSHFQQMREDWRYRLLPVSCAIKVLGRVNLPMPLDEVEWPLPWPGDEQ